MKVKLLSFLTLFCLSLLFPFQPVLAVAPSNKVLTKVGKPTTPPPSLGGNLDVVGQDLFNAYKNCTGGTGSTAASPQLATCLQKTLKGDGYDGTLVDQVTNLSNFTATSGNVECIQFIRQAIILAYGGEDPRLVGANGNTPYSWDSMNNNGHILVKISGPPRAGDIAVNPGGNSDDSDTTLGHISIVKSVESIYFTAYEANFRTGLATADVNTHPIEDYVYFREQ